MGDVVDLDSARVARTRDAAEHAAMHPALRWVAGEVYWVAHRRAHCGDAACGAPGALILAPPGVPLCDDCYPAPDRRRRGR